jgi:adenylate kinase family enzyme
MANKTLNKILIVGDAGRGKSTLAEKISKKLGIPHHSTDDFFYEVKFSKVRDRPESIEQIKEIFKKEKWIVEGTTKMLYKFLDIKIYQLSGWFS